MPADTLPNRLRLALPGVLLALVLAMAARFVSEHYGGPGMLYALLFGIAFNYLAKDARYAPGIAAASRTILRLGVALLGARLTLGDLSALGGLKASLVVGSVALSILGGWGIARLCGLRRDLAILTAGAVSICGASAAMAVAAILPDHERKDSDTIMTVVVVTSLSTVAMIAYPLVVGLLDMDDAQAGIFLGATIHDVAQVVGAGYMVSDEAGLMATMVKLLRVACLVPVVLILSLIWRKKRDAGDDAPQPGLLARLPIPLFLIGFLLLAAINSTGTLPAPLTDGMADASGWCIITAVAALGIKTSLKDLMKTGPAPLTAMTLQTLFLGALVLGWLFLLA